MNPDSSNTIEKWYQEYKEEFPWGESADPYVVWISEIILQQIHVVQGYDYFVQSMRRFPDIAALAQADKDKVMKYWQGLGYYSHARNLYAAAKSMNGVFPKTYPEVRALRGVGDCTATTICSFTYNIPCAVVDGSVYQVFSRYLDIDTPVDSTEGKKLFTAVAGELLDKGNPALCDRAIMDFEAIQCSPQSPNYMFCPLAGDYSTLTGGMVVQLPVKQHKTKTINRYLNYIYVHVGAYTLINKRMGNNTWKNLFEFPLIETPEAVSEGEFPALPELRVMFAEGETPIIDLVCRDVKHVLLHRVIYANSYMVDLPENSQSFTSYQKIKADELEQYAVLRLVHAFIEKYIN